jgi:hypothetical protein
MYLTIEIGNLRSRLLTLRFQSRFDRTRITVRSDRYQVASPHLRAILNIRPNTSSIDRTFEWKPIEQCHM